MLQSFALLLVTVAIVACSSTPEPVPYGLPAPPGTICTMEARPAIAVQPVDGSTSKPVTGAVTVIVRDGLYADTAELRVGVPPGAVTVSVAYERAGTYSVLVRHPAYRDWQRNGVEVVRDDCHVKTVVLRPELRQ